MGGRWKEKGKWINRCKKSSYCVHNVFSSTMSTSTRHQLVRHLYLMHPLLTYTESFVPRRRASPSPLFRLSRFDFRLCPFPLSSSSDRRHLFRSFFPWENLQNAPPPSWDQRSPAYPLCRYPLGLPEGLPRTSYPIFCGLLFYLRSPPWLTPHPLTRYPPPESPYYPFGPPYCLDFLVNRTPMRRRACFEVSGWGESLLSLLEATDRPKYRSQCLSVFVGS
jgi:hypothetical protein